MFKCNVCDKCYASKKALYKHERLKHNVSYECYNCGVIYNKKVQLKSHVKVHKTKSRTGRLLCPIEVCQEKFGTYYSLRDHLTRVHNFSIKEELHQFQNNSEFVKWKKEMEQSFSSSYVLDTAQKRLKSGLHRRYYACHRSYISRQIDQPKRNQKGIGTNKINRACPSTILVTTMPEGNLSVVFYPLHAGHSCEVGRLRLNEDDRNKIAGKLSQGVTVQRVLHDIRENVPNKHIDRLHLLEKKDIHNIMRDFSIGYSTKRHKNDAVSVKLWVEAMKNVNNNPILYFKEQGDDNTIFEINDFVLIIMTEFQLNLLSLLGKEKICIDGTHGLNSYDFQLYTIVVVDEFGSGIPVAFCISNRCDVTLFQVYFQCLKDKCGVITTNVFMSDDYPAFYNAWENIMGTVTHRLLCSWHINKNWLQNANKIANKDKRTLVLKTLRVLQKELDEEKFLSGLENFNSQLQI